MTTARHISNEGIEILRVLCGSRAYGLETDESDFDYHGVYVVPTSRLLSLGPKVKETAWIEGEDQDNTAWEIGHFLKLAINCNPTVLETFVAPIMGTSNESVNMTYVPAWLGRGQALRELFPYVLSRKRVYDSFRGYASNQRKKMFEPVGGTRGVDREIKAAIAYLRSLYHGINLLNNGTYNPRIASPLLRDYLLALRKVVRVDYGSVVGIAQDLEAEITEAYIHSSMQQEPDIKHINDFLLQVRKDFW